MIQNKQKYKKVADLVAQLYISSDSSFAKWMWEFHVPVVAQFCEELTEKYKGNPDFSIAGGWLHDIADVFTDRFPDSQHEVLSLKKAKEILQKTGYNKNEIEIIIQKILIPHSCYPGNVPTTLDGKIMATADALAHITTDFYMQLCWQHRPEGKTYEEFIQWVGEKIERDYRAKIFFEDEKNRVKEKYDALKLVFAD